MNTGATASSTKEALILIMESILDKHNWMMIGILFQEIISIYNPVSQYQIGTINKGV